MFGMNVMAWSEGDLEKLKVLQNRVNKPEEPTSSVAEAANLASNATDGATTPMSSSEPTPDTAISIGDVTDGSNVPEPHVSAPCTSSGRSCARDGHHSDCNSHTMMLSVAGRLRRMQTRHGR
ncbi:hypothetical protein FHG87_024463 [Trinorchestia longiramus]|nr:hypothetical protein FHG87_024463 [Trinorchestia longiramus]